MTRLTIAALLASTAVATIVAANISYFVPVSANWAVTERAWLSLQFFDGRVRLFWITSQDEAIELSPTSRGADFRVQPVSESDSRTERAGNGPARTGRGRPLLIRIGDRRAVGPFGGQWRSPTGQGRRSGAGTQGVGGGGSGGGQGQSYPELSYVRMPFLVPVVILLYHPVRTVITGSWMHRWRRRRNQCLRCGYSLIGNMSGICPECGTPISEDGTGFFYVRT